MTDNLSPDELEEHYARTGTSPNTPVTWTYDMALSEGYRYGELARVVAEDNDWKRFISTSMANTSRLELANYYQTRSLSFFQLAQLLKP